MSPFIECSKGPRKERIALLTAASLSWNPRAFREAKALAHAGYDVAVYGWAADEAQRKADESLAQKQGFTFTSVLPKSLFISTCRRIRRRIGAEFHKYLRSENAWELGPAVVDLDKQAKEATADFYLAHLEQGAWVGARLGSSGAFVGVDMEDWYSEDLLPESRKARPLRLLRNVERRLLTTSEHATCPSRAMSQALTNEFGCRPPTVVYNASPWSDRKSMDGLFKDRTDRQLPSIHWFSQTIGQGRGLEDLFAALPLLNHEAEIHLRGKPVAGFEAWLATRVPKRWCPRVLVHERVVEAELPSRVAEHDIGFAGEMKYCRNRDLTVSNKILQYLLAGLAVVASDTAGQCEVAAQAPGGVFLYPSGDPAALAACLDRLLGSADVLRRAKAAALDAAERTFCWERQEKALVDSVARALRSPGAREQTQSTVPV